MADDVPPTVPDALLDNQYVRLKACRQGPMAYMTGDRYVGRWFDLYGEYAEDEWRMLDQLLKPGMVALDIGANIGAHTIPMARKVGPAGRVLAFEPQRQVFQLLCANAALGALANVVARHAAVGREPDEITVPRIDYEKGGNFGGLALGGFDTGEQVPVVTVDGLGLAQCHVMKIDVEGMENDVLEGAADTIGRLRPVLYVENDRRERSEELLGRLMSMDFRIYWHLPRLYGPDNFFANPENVFDNIVSRNVLCLPKERDVNVVDMREITDAKEAF
jgi:FkbM family methyltransferase